MSLTGTSDTIQIVPLAPSAISVDLKTLMKKTIEDPITFFDSVHD
jgi:hypothetical protein